MVSTPKAPDPKDTAAAQSGMNRDTAQTQQLTNMINQVGPDGSLTYRQTGKNTFVDSTGKTVTIPQFTATTALSPQQQAIKDQTDAASLNLGTIANERSEFLKDYLSTPFDVNSAVEDKINTLGSARLDPRFAADEEKLRTRLANQGIQEGSEAWKAAFDNFAQGKNDAYNQLALTGRSQAYQEASAERAQPLNEIIGLLSGSQVQQPQFVNTPQTNVAGVDYAGLVSDKYKADTAASQAKMGGLFGLLASPFQMFSFGA